MHVIVCKWDPAAFAEIEKNVLCWLFAVTHVVNDHPLKQESFSFVTGLSCLLAASACDDELICLSQ